MPARKPARKPNKRKPATIAMTGTISRARARAIGQQATVRAGVPLRAGEGVFIERGVAYGATAAMDKETLARIGSALFGPRWQKELAAAVQVSLRTMHYLAAGERPVSPGLVSRLRAIVAARRALLADLEIEIRE